MAQKEDKSDRGEQTSWDDSRRLNGNNVNEKTVEPHVHGLKEKNIDLEFCIQQKYLSSIKVKGKFFQS